MRTPKDKQLSELADQIGLQVVFDDPEGLIRQRLYKYYCTHGFTYKAVTGLGKFNVVRITIAGEQRTVAKFPANRQVDAVRFADLCIHHFWKYRKTNRPCDDSDLTLGSDLFGSAPVLALSFIEQIEEHLRASGALEDFRKAGPPLDSIAAHQEIVVAWKKLNRAIEHLRNFATTSQESHDGVESVRKEIEQSIHKFNAYAGNT